MRITVYRRLTQIIFMLFIILVPVLDILRFDSDNGEIIVFGNTWSLGLKEDFLSDNGLSGSFYVASRFFLKAILPWLGILALFPLLGLFLGRTFCGWLCPEGALFEFFDFLTLRLFGRRNLFKKSSNDPNTRANNRLPYVIIALLSMIVIPLLVSVSLVGYFVKPQIVWNQIINGHFTSGVKAGLIGVSIYIFISSIIVRHTLCKYVCSVGLMQMLVGWVSPISLRVKMQQRRARLCTDCRACEKACFMDVKPRLPKRDINCVNCGECIDACNRELGRGLFEFTWNLRALLRGLHIPCREPKDRDRRLFSQ